jgi:RNA polymerase sigma-70 factor (ECF subfamily)
MANGVLTLTAAGLLSDEQVVERVLAGETALYEVIMRRYNTRLYRVARAILNNDGEAEDVMQEAYVRAFQHLRQFEGRARFSTWLTRIAVHEAWARIRRASRFEEWTQMDDTKSDKLGPAQSVPDAESHAASSELNKILELAIESLPEHYRAVVIMRDVEEMSTAETAACLSLTEDNVKIRLHRAHGLLRKELFRRARISTTQVLPFHASRCDRVVTRVFGRLAAVRS